MELQNILPAEGFAMRDNAVQQINNIEKSFLL